MEKTQREGQKMGQRGKKMARERQNQGQVKKGGREKIQQLLECRGLTGPSAGDV